MPPILAMTLIARGVVILSACLVQSLGTSPGFPS